MQGYQFTLKEKREIATNTESFWFEKSEDFDFKPGQHAVFKLIHPTITDEHGNTRPFSIASAPHESDLMITMRMTPSVYKESLDTLPVGAPVEVHGPMGTFTMHEDAVKPAVFLAGGIGITPFRSMILDSLERKTGHHLTLFYANKTPEETAYLEEFEQLAAAHENFQFVPTVTKHEGSVWKYENGRVDKEMIEKYISNLNEPVYYTAGPPGMVHAIQELLKEEQVPEDQIRVEVFSGY